MKNKQHPLGQHRQDAPGQQPQHPIGPAQMKKRLRVVVRTQGQTLHGQVIAWGERGATIWFDDQSMYAVPYALIRLATA